MTRPALPFLVALGLAGCNSTKAPGATTTAPPASSPTPTTTAAAPPASSVAPTTSAKPASDGAIDALVARLRPTHGLWSNGMFPKLDSAEGAKTTEVLTEMFTRTSFDKGKNVSKFDILEERDVSIGDSRPYRAVRLETDRGKMTVLLRFDRDKWWTRVFAD